jgi:hypothetical protein
MQMPMTVNQMMGMQQPMNHSNISADMINHFDQTNEHGYPISSNGISKMLGQPTNQYMPGMQMPEMKMPQMQGMQMPEMQMGQMNQIGQMNQLSQMSEMQMPQMQTNLIGGKVDIKNLAKLYTPNKLK